MNDNHLFATLAIGASLAMGAPAVNADYLPPTVEARLQAAADQGPSQLHQFVWRTRMIYNIRVEDVADRLGADEGDPSGEASGESTDAGEPEAASPADDSFSREFFRNDARD